MRRYDESLTKPASVSSVYSTITTASLSGGIIPPVEIRIASPAPKRLRRFLAHLNDAGKLQVGRQTLTRAECVFCLHCVTVHGSAVEMRQIDAGIEILGQNPSARPDGSNLLRSYGRHLQQRSQSFLRRYDFEKGLCHLGLPDYES